MARRHDGQGAVAEKGGVFVAIPRAAQVDEAEIDLVAGQALDDRAVISRDDLEMDLGRDLAEMAEQPRQERLEAGGAVTNHQTSTGGVAQAVHRLFQVVGAPGEVAGQREELRAGLSEVDALAVAHEQGQSERMLERADLLAHRRLREVPSPRRRREAALLGHGEEDLELVKAEQNALPAE